MILHAFGAVIFIKEYDIGAGGHFIEFLCLLPGKGEFLL